MSQIIERVKQSLKEGLEQIDKIAIKHNIEIWKPVNGYPNYEVSSNGRMRIIKTGYIMKQRINKGYPCIDLRLNGIKKFVSVHRMVANAFIPNPLQKTQVDHIDNDRKNNKVTNLRHVTASENGMNRSLSSKNTSGIKGVSYSKKQKKWYAHIKINGRKKNIGYYETIEEATDARQCKATEQFGQFTNSCEKQ